MGKRMVLLVLVCCMVLSGCRASQKEKVDLSDYNFVGVEWTRHTEQCVETLRFRADGDCSYYCACGEPVNDDDLCEGYRYDPTTKTIYLEFAESTETAVTQFTVKSCDGQTLVLDFGGEERIFQNAEEASEWVDVLEYEGRTYRYLQFPEDIFYYDLRESVDYEEDTVLPIPHDQWDLVYREGDLFVLEAQWEAAVAEYADRANYTWSIWIDDPKSEESYNVPITVTEEDLSFIYSMEERKADTSLFFKDIQVFGSLIKTHKDGLIAASTSLAYYDGTWYWRSDVTDVSVEGWPEYVVRLTDSLTTQIPDMQPQ